jgi:hypothetical protein
MGFGPFIDAHVHADGLRDADLDTLAAFGVEQVILCAHDGAIERPGDSARPWLEHWDALLGREGPRFRRHGVRPLFAFGVHPAHAPWRGFDELLHKLPQYLSDPAAVALGALGLKDGTPREQQVLARQLELAGELRRPVIVSSSPLDPVRGPRALARALVAAGVAPERVLVEHATVAALPTLSALGWNVALEPASGRLEAAQVVRIIQRFGAERFVLTSHAGEGPADLLAVPGMAARLVDAGLPEGVVARVARENALRFVGRLEGARRRTG